jgi:hypothetical protein
MTAQEKKTRSLKKTLSKMKWWAKEKDRRYKVQQKTARKAFGALVKKLGKKKQKD